jgi:hypothetical protein
MCWICELGVLNPIFSRFQLQVTQCVMSTDSIACSQYLVYSYASQMLRKMLKYDHIWSAGPCFSRGGSYGKRLCWEYAADVPAKHFPPPAQTGENGWKSLGRKRVRKYQC